MLTPLERERRMQVIGLLIVLGMILLFTMVRAGWHAFVPRSWW